MVTPTIIPGNIFLLIAFICVLSSDGLHVDWTEQHSICVVQINAVDRTAASAHTVSGNNVSCNEAPYMTAVRRGLSKPGNSQHKLIYEAIESLYIDLEEMRKPAVVNIGVSSTNPQGTVLIHPISFAIQDELILRTVPPKTKLFGQVIPGDYTTYFDLVNETHYYEDMQHSLFSITHKKNGWDCLRHLEIMAIGSLPFFIGIKHCPHQTMALYPKKLFKALLHFPGVDAPQGFTRTGNAKDSGIIAREFSLNPKTFDRRLYNTAVAAMLQYTRNVMSTKAMASYVLETISTYSGGATPASTAKKILYLTHQDHDMDKGDYMTDFLLMGLKSLFTEKTVVDFPRRDGIYKTDAEFNLTEYRDRRKQLYGNGFTWGLRLDDFSGSDSERTHDAVKEGIIKHKYDLVILGSGHRDGWAAKLFYWDLVCKHYKPSEVAWVCGSDKHTPKKRLVQYSPCAGHLFSREGAPDRF